MAVGHSEAVDWLGMRTKGNWSFHGLCSGETDVSGNSRYNIVSHFGGEGLWGKNGIVGMFYSSGFLSPMPVCWLKWSKVLACVVYVCTHMFLCVLWMSVGCSCICMHKHSETRGQQWALSAVFFKTVFCWPTAHWLGHAWPGMRACLASVSPKINK